MSLPSAKEAMSPASSTKPSRASASAGAISSSRGFVPYFSRAVSKPATEPGTPTASQVSVLAPGTGSPASSRYMSLVAASGARSRKSRKVVVPSASRMVMNPPPPRLPAVG